MSSGIHINPAHKGETRARLHAKSGEKLSVSDLLKDERKARKHHNTKVIRQDQFAINQKSWHHGS